MAGLQLRKVTPPWQVLLVFGVVAISLVASVLLIFSTIEVERDQREQVARTSAILAQLRNLNRAAINGESGQRGYFITLDRRYLAPYLSAKELNEPALARLRELIEEDASPRQEELLREIERLSRAKFAELDRSVALIETGQLIEAQQQILSDEGQLVMARLRNAITEMEAADNKMLAEATAEVSANEARILPLLGLLLFMLLCALGLGYYQVSRTAAAEAAAGQAAKLAQAHDRADLLARELNHRVKNLFAMILAIVRMSGRGRPEAAPVVDSIDRRIRALLTAHEVTQGAPEDARADLRELIETTLAPYEDTGATAKLDGPQLGLPAQQVTPLGLVLHELTTNAVKYGSWSRGGTVDIRWVLEEGQLAIHWSEHGDTDHRPDTKEGFGSMLIQGAARQLNGEITREFADDGLRVRIAFPCQAG